MENVTDMLFQIGLSNVLLSLVLAVVAMIVGATTKRPHIVYVLWLLVFVKLLTPPVVTIPVITSPGLYESTFVSVEAVSQTPDPLIDVSAETWISILVQRKEELSLIWLLGMVLVFAWSLVRVYRFNRLLRLESEIASPELQRVAARIANRLRLKTTPTIYTTSAHLSPLVWWAGGKVRIVVPDFLLYSLDPQQFQWMLAHELAHVRRWDYLVRWIEWLASVCFWWNPVMWWARYNLHAHEELCCDALVVSSLSLKPHAYATSLLKVVEFLAGPSYRPPAMASEINSGGFLERRFKMIVSDQFSKSNARWMWISLILSAIVLLPLGVGCREGGPLTNAEERGIAEELLLSIQKAEKTGDLCNKAGLEEFGTRLRMAVVSGEISREEAGQHYQRFQKACKIREEGGTDCASVIARIKKAHEAGEITRAEAGERIRAAGCGTQQEGENDCEAGLRERLGRAVEDGTISGEQARERYRQALEAGVCDDNASNGGDTR